MAVFTWKSAEHCLMVHCLMELRLELMKTEMKTEIKTEIKTGLAGLER